MTTPLTYTPVGLVEQLRSSVQQYEQDIQRLNGLCLCAYVMWQPCCASNGMVTCARWYVHHAYVGHMCAHVHECTRTFVCECIGCLLTVHVLYSMCVVVCMYCVCISGRTGCVSMCVCVCVS